MNAAVIGAAVNPVVSMSILITLGIMVAWFYLGQKSMKESQAFHVRAAKAASGGGGSGGGGGGGVAPADLSVDRLVLQAANKRDIMAAEALSGQQTSTGMDAETLALSIIDLLDDGAEAAREARGSFSKGYVSYEGAGDEVLVNFGHIGCDFMMSRRGLAGISDVRDLDGIINDGIMLNPQSFK